MAISLLEKARAGRFAALESLNTPYKNKRPDTDIFQLDFDMPEITHKPMVRFISRREKAQGHFLAA